MPDPFDVLAALIRVDRTPDLAAAAAAYLGYKGKVKAVSPGSVAVAGAGDDFGNGQRQGGMVGPGLCRAVRGGHQARQGSHVPVAPRIAPVSLPTSSSIWASSMMKGGARRTWSPCSPSMVPPIG